MGARDDWVRATVEAMTLEQKVGQLFVPYLTGGDVAAAAPENTARFGVPTPAEALARFHFGGVIYFAWSGNTVDPQQVARLSNGLQRASAEAGNPVPLSIATDQETGSSTRIGPPATVFPGAMALGAAGDPRLTERTYAIVGEELGAIGINTDYAPVADVNVNPANPVIGVRSFGSEPDRVADHVAAAVRGLQSQGVTATAKHFPGHGDTAEDSHTTLPVITHTRRQWEQIDAPPFRAAITAGVDAIMTAHLSFPALEPSGDPATLSTAVLTGLLRNELGFPGVIVTDSLRMAGVRELYDDAEVPVRALEAGADVLLDPPQPELQIAAVMEAVRSGRLAETRIEESIRRILLMKWNRGVIAQPYVDLAAVEQIVGAEHHRRAAQRIADQTTTLVVDRAGIVPLSSKESVFVTGWGDAQLSQLADGLASSGRAVGRLVTGPEPSASLIDDAVRHAERHDLIMVCTLSAWRDVGQSELVTALRSTGRPLLVIALGDPYDIAFLERIDSCLATYSSTPVAIEAALGVITGRIRAAGRLPVDLP